MPTLKQLEANRLNALKSTGPKTPEGKRVSSQNALKSGLDAESQIVPGESPEEFARLQAEYYALHRPATAGARFQVDALIRNEWLLRRFHRIEAQLWQFHASHSASGTGFELGEVWAKADAQFMRLQRRITAAEKAHRPPLPNSTASRPSPKSMKPQPKPNIWVRFVKPP
jgi:hypothetical protein